MCSIRVVEKQLTREREQAGQGKQNYRRVGRGMSCSVVAGGWSAVMFFWEAEEGGGWLKVFGIGIGDWLDGWLAGLAESESVVVGIIDYFA